MTPEEEADLRKRLKKLKRDRIVWAAIALILFGMTAGLSMRI